MELRDVGTVQAARDGKRGAVWTCVLFGVALLPAIYLAWLIASTAVNILYVDEWALVSLFRNLATHTLTVKDMFAQHNESRPAVPLLMMLGVGSVTHWDVRWDMWMGFGFACLVSLNLYVLSRRVMGMGRKPCLFLWIIANLMLFSTAQSQNWTWGLQMIVVMPMFFISAGMVIAFSRMHVTWKFVLAILMASASTYSFAIGQIAWILLVPPLLVGSWHQTRKFGWRLVVWVAACAINLVIYYFDYSKPRTHPSLLLALSEPKKALEYFMGFLGAPLAQGYHRMDASVAFGVVLLACLAAACGHLWRIRRQPGIAGAATVWLVLCAYGLASACTTTAGRLGIGVQQSQESRYTGFSIYLVIGLVYLGALIVRDVYRQGAVLSARMRAALGIGLVLVPYVSTEIGGSRQMWEDRRVRLAQKACTQLLNLFPSPQNVYMNRKAPVEKDFLDKMGILSPGLVKSADLRRISGPEGGDSFGEIELITSETEASFEVGGWAILPQWHEPGPVVLLAAEDGRGTAVAIGEVVVGGARPDVAKRLHVGAYLKSGWKVRLNVSDVPAGTTIISAWVYDPENGMAYRMGQARAYVHTTN